ncbi:MAG: hypothetical protein ABW104_08395 [Candidatus Thiodiazotropha sp. 6PLUC2]
MPNIEKQIEALKAEITRLEKEQQKADQEKRALRNASEQITAILKENDVSFEAYIGYQLKKVSRIVDKLLEKQATKASAPVKKPVKSRTTSKRRQAVKSKAKITVKIPAGQYGKLPAQPEQVFEVKEKGPRPKILKAYAEEIGLEAFLSQCRIN